MDRKLIQKIRKNVSGKVLPGEPLARHTTYHVGGKAELLVIPRDAEDAARVYSFVKNEGVPLVVIGAGSNVIAPDEGIDGVVLRTAAASARILYLGGGRVRADAGVPLLDFVRAASARGLIGLEPLAGIPGTVGGAVVMNAGTRDTETAAVLGRVEVLTSTGRRRMFAAGECSFGYRRSIFLETDWFILGAEFRLGRGNAAASVGMVDSFLKEREGKYPLDLPSAGSVFKRPRGDYAGRLIEEAGCKGMRVGGALVSERHANFIVNAGSATASDIMELIARVRRAVCDKTGTCLELEQIPLGVHASCIERPHLS